MSSAQQAKVSFTIRRPTSASDSDSSFKIPTLSRHLSGHSTPNSPLARSSPPSPKHKSRTYTERDSSDEGSGPEDELVTGFDQFGVQRLHEKPEPQGPLVIPALKNKDWRELARKRKQLYVPHSAAPATGADGSVGGLGTRDVINSGPQSVGLQVKKRLKVEESEDVPVPPADSSNTEVKKEEAEAETDDQRALRAILASAAGGGDAGLYGPQIDVIPAPSEDDVYKQDIEELPESATLADYERVPVAQFGAALLRGMGWKEGTAASKKGKGPVEPYLPPARPALLGIGAKEKEVFDDGSKRKGGKGRPERRYVPVIKKERDGGSGRESSSRPRSPVSSSRNGSRKPSRSPSPNRRKDRDGRGDDRDRYRDNDRDRSDRRRDRDFDPSRRDRERVRRRDDDYESARRDKDREYDSSHKARDRDRDYDSSRRDRDRRGEGSADKYDSSRRKDRY